MKQIVKTAAILGIITLLVAGCASSATTSESYQVQAGEVITKTIQGVTVHSYMMPDSNMTNILETENSLIVLDMVGSVESGQELSRYIEFLGKPVSRVYISHNHTHHLVMVDALAGVPVYTLDTALPTFSTVDTSQYVVPTETVSAGSETVDNILMEYTSDPAGSILYISFPELKLIWIQHLIYSGFHLPMPGAPIDMMLADVEGYDYYIASHGVPGGPTMVQDFKDYQNTVNQAVADAQGPEEAIAAIKDAYPDWMGVFLLDMLIPGAFEE